MPVAVQQSFELDVVTGDPSTPYDPAAADRLAADDTASREQLTELEAGRLAPDRISEVAAAAEMRLEQGFDGLELASRFDDAVYRPVINCADALSAYAWRVHEVRDIREHGPQLQKAALKLADLLAKTGRSDYYRLMDPGIWDDCPDDYVGPNIRVEDYLRRLAENFAEPSRADLAHYAHSVRSRHSVNLARFVIRDVADTLIGLWKARRLGEQHPEDFDRLPNRMHQWIAEVASVLLAREVKAAEVHEAIR